MFVLSPITTFKGFACGEAHFNNTKTRQQDHKTIQLAHQYHQLPRNRSTISLWIENYDYS
ncbi:hypothetical protein BPOR_1019g00020 [Botrytis porri]|uniref:Uncharacterized protein n=1 Tax=Botrytis porri TaxID=87229 RepID=A0A4Z1K6P8_9HELO|nr:hypothetical protein BPOR_1019g00020 [Botrytis porri]